MEQYYCLVENNWVKGKRKQCMGRNLYNTIRSGPGSTGEPEFVMNRGGKECT